MPATLLTTRRVEKPWGRHDLWPGFADPAPDATPIGEVWFQEPGGADPELLVKYLFTSEHLSVQVHPTDAEAHRAGYKRGKDEAWLILAAEPDATIALGTKRAMSKDELRAASEWGRESRPASMTEPVRSRPGGALAALPGSISIARLLIDRWLTQGARS